MNALEEALAHLAAGGLVMPVLLVVGALGWFRALWLAWARPTLRERDRVEAARWLAEPAPLAPPAALGPLLETVGGHPPPGRRRGLARAVLASETHLLDARGRADLRVVAACAAALPLLGLLGTIAGIVRAFDVLHAHGTGRVHLLGEGIAQALITTQAGLLLALPLLFVHRYLRGRHARTVRTHALLCHELLRERAETGRAGEEAR